MPLSSQFRLAESSIDNARKALDMAKADAAAATEAIATAHMNAAEADAKVLDSEKVLIKAAESLQGIRSTSTIPGAADLSSVTSARCSMRSQARRPPMKQLQLLWNCSDPSSLLSRLRLSSTTLQVNIELDIDDSALVSFSEAVVVKVAGERPEHRNARLSKVLASRLKPRKSKSHVLC